MSFERHSRPVSGRVAGGLVGSTLLMLGATAALGQMGNTAAAAPVPTDGGGLDAKTVELTGEERGYVQLSNVQGDFSFTQDSVSPGSDVFNIFGTTVNTMCSKPNPELVESEGGVANYYVNVGGDIRKAYTVDVRELAKDGSESKILTCSCVNGLGVVQARVIGVPLSAVVEMADLDEGVNTVTAYGTDGFGTPLPLRYALEKNALLVYQINDQDVEAAAGTGLQLWVPQTVARYFTRNVVDIELTARDKEPDVIGVDADYRNKVSILNRSDGCVFLAGNDITFSGTADDLGSPVASVEFSFDGGETWTVCATEGATEDKWVDWSFTTSFDEPGDYQMNVRARTADGVVSPLEATLTFLVIER